ncbi:6-hydroxy-D-nicotine oxidase [Hypsizygus marmoreus]|uniref:6-hydroxy-D-nicotine oxidase n=1 Tax=Hypsizygus marmoreus TaxID=39966 RepID=A0A369J8W3_HYPMA|nr:6-hydroxy-D-nicotine oxidase [Hypsizygus marmoreus]
MADFSAFKNAFKGDIVTPADQDYEAAIARWALNAKRRAKVVAFVKDEADVGLAIKYARANALPIAIRGGGHSPAGASSSENGLVIDLSRYLNTAKADPEKKVVHVGGGALWEAVDKEAIKYGLATVGGTVNHTGVGGLALGGGYGWLSSAHGMVVDNFVQATVVTADGSVLTASDYENPDLFFGIRGGGSNFGVVTEFVFKLHPQRSTVYAGFLIFPPPALERVVAVTAEWWSKAGEKEALLMMTTIGPDGNPAVIVFPFYNGTEAEGRANFKAFLDISPVMDTTREMPYEELNGIQNFVTYHGQGIYMKGVTHHGPDYALISKVYQKAIEVSQGGEFKANVLYEYFPLGKIGAVSQGVTAFRRDPVPGVVVGTLWKEDSAEIAERARRATHELTTLLTEGQSDADRSQALGYSNYDPAAVTGEKDAVPDKAKLVFAENYPRLQATKKRYDPDNVFNKWFPITPA